MGKTNWRGGKQTGEGGNKLEREETNWRGRKQTGDGGNKPEGEVKTSQNFLRPCWVLWLHESSHVNIRDSMMS